MFWHMSVCLIVMTPVTLCVQYTLYSSRGYLLGCCLKAGYLDQFVEAKFESQLSETVVMTFEI